MTRLIHKASELETVIKRGDMSTLKDLVISSKVLEELLEMSAFAVRRLLLRLDVPDREVSIDTTVYKNPKTRRHLVLSTMNYIGLIRVLCSLTNNRPKELAKESLAILLDLVYENA